MLPAIRGLAKGGRALHWEDRLVKLYGRDAVGWPRAAKAGAMIGHDFQEFAALRKAKKAIWKGDHLGKSLADKVAKTIDVS